MPASRWVVWYSSTRRGLDGDGGNGEGGGGMCACLAAGTLSMSCTVEQCTELNAHTPPHTHINMSCAHRLACVTEFLSVVSLCIRVYMCVCQIAQLMTESQVSGGCWSQMPLSLPTFYGDMKKERLVMFSTDQQHREPGELW